MAKRILVIALTIVLTMASAHAQGMGGGMGGGVGGRHQQRGKKANNPTPKPKVDEKAYNAAIKSIPDKPFDAWGGVR